MSCFISRGCGFRIRSALPGNRCWRASCGERVKGELGWSAEWRKETLTRADARLRTPKWRRYACESFCDSAAWMFAGLRAHDEFTLAAAARRLRRRWFTEQFSASRPVAV